MGRGLRLDDAGRRYGLRGTWVLRNVDLEPAPGTLTRVQGANGTGKSTLLRLLARIDAPTEGRITGHPAAAAALLTAAATAAACALTSHRSP